MIVSSVINRPVQVSVLSNTYAANIAALKDIDISEMAGNTQISVAGYYTPGDGGGGIFYYDSGSSATDNGGTVIAPDAGSGRWKRIYSGPIDIRWFGAVSDGHTDSAASLVNALSCGPVSIIGPYAISSVVLPDNASITGGGSLISTPGATGSMITLGHGSNVINVEIDGTGRKSGNLIDGSYVQRVNVADCYIHSGPAAGVMLSYCDYLTFRDNHISMTVTAGSISGFEINISGNKTTFNSFGLSVTETQSAGSSSVSQLVEDGVCGLRDTTDYPDDCDITGSNLCVNGNFASGTTGWTSSDPSELSHDPALTHTADGGGSLRLTTVNNLATARSTKFAVLPNRFYKVTGYINGSIDAQLRIQQYLSDQITSSNPQYPMWASALGEVAGWKKVESIFLAANDAAWAQVYLLIQVNGTVAFDDIDVRLIEAEAPFTKGNYNAVKFLGHPSIMGMGVTGIDLSSDGKTLTVDTAGAHFSLHSDTGVMSGSQTIGGSRDRFSAQLPTTTGSLSIVERSDENVIVTCDKYDVSFQGDSMAVMTMLSGSTAVVTVPFTPNFQEYNSGYYVGIDGIGGLAIYPNIQSGTGLLDGFSVSGTLPSPLTYTIRDGGRLAVSVFPPRPFDWQKSFDDQILHSDYYPPKSTLQDWSSIANVIILHENIWKGSGAKAYGQYTPQDEGEFIRVINDAHSLGLRIAPYLSSDFYVKQKGQDFITEVKRLRDAYGFDSIYYDGINAYDWPYAYETMRQTRDLFPTGCVYLHISYGLPFRKNDKELFLPQLESLADYTLQGESVTMNEWTDPYLNYVARGYTVSNAIGTLKYDSFRVGGVLQNESQVLAGLPGLNMRQRMLGYPTGTYPSLTYPSASAIKTAAWITYANTIASMRATWINDL